MKQLTFFLICLTSLLAFGSSGVKLPSGWEPMAGAQYNMSLYAQVGDFDGRLVEVPGSVLAVFDAAGVCRGAAAVEVGPGGLWYRVTVVSNLTAENGLALKVLSASDGEVHDLKETLDFAADTTVPAEDYTTKPLTLHYKPLTAELSITLVQNWNWISFNVEQGERSILEFLADYTQHATDGDIIKSQNGQATYSGGQWYALPRSFRLEPGRMYKLRKQKSGRCAITVAGAPCEGGVPISVVAGWNWLGYVGESETSVASLTKDGGFGNNDLVKPQSGSQATYSGGQWYGNLVFRPGQGYMLKQATAGSVSFQ